VPHLCRKPSLPAPRSSYEAGGSRSIDFTTANLDIRKIEGAWKSASGDPETSGYTLTVNPDGTFTASLGEKFSGTWSFFDYSDEEGCRYGFDFHGEKNGRLFTLVSETELRIWVKAGKQTVTVTMKKS